jgi:ribosomal protein S18 acetylase RimI-like enzyme
MDGLSSSSITSINPFRPSYISDASWEFFQEVACDGADRVVIARPINKRRVVGWFRFSLERKPTRHLTAQGTWVDEEFRKLGLAKEMWDMAFKEYYPSTVSVVTVSKEGRKLIRAMKLKHIRVLFFNK